MLPSPDVFRTLELAHWRSGDLAKKCAMDVYRVGYRGGLDRATADAPLLRHGWYVQRWEALLSVRVEDAFAPGRTWPSEASPRPRPRPWASMRPLPTEVVAAFEMMLVTGEIEAAYDYACGSRHEHMTFRSIQCEHSPDFVHKNGRTLLAAHAVRVVSSVVASTTIYTADGGALI